MSRDPPRRGVGPGRTRATDPERTPRRFTALGATVAAEPLPPGLHVVATPIGNLADVTIRALRTLAAADAVLAEDTRVTRVLLSHYGISTPLVAYHDHSPPAVTERLLARLDAGEALALASDAGTPLVSDPGYRLVAAAAARGLPVVPVPGPSAALAGLVAAGLPTDRFLFEGFLPPRQAARRRRLAELAGIPATLVLYEAPHRLAATLADAAAVLGARPAAIGRELTKKFEEVRRGTLEDLAAAYGADATPRGEVVLVVGAAPPGAAEEAMEASLDDRLRQALAGGSVKDAAARVAAETGLPRREVYGRALALAREGGEP